MKSRTPRDTLKCSVSVGGLLHGMRARGLGFMGVKLGLYWGCIRAILGLYWENGKENGNYHYDILSCVLTAHCLMIPQVQSFVTSET